MKQMPANPNQSFAFQPMQARPQWSAYQQPAQQAQNIASTSSASTTSGLMGLLKKLNPAGGNLTDTLDQIQKFLKMAQSVTPKIQEYGPIIKNLPAMLEMMKEFDDEEEPDSEQSEQEDDSTDELDKLLGLDQENEEPETEVKQVKTNEPIKETIQADNLYKIETFDDQKKPEYQEPMLFI